MQSASRASSVVHQLMTQQTHAKQIHGPHLTIYFFLITASFYTNPQYHVTLTDVDEDDDDNMCTVVVALMQKNRRAMKRHGGGNLTIGYEIYQVL